MMYFQTIELLSAGTPKVYLIDSASIVMYKINYH